MNEPDKLERVVGHAVSFGGLARRLADPKLTIVNVLPRAAWEGSRIPGSLSLPLAEIPARAREVLPELDREIIVYCAGPT